MTPLFISWHKMVAPTLNHLPHALGTLHLALFGICCVCTHSFRDASGKPYNAWPKAAVVIYGAWSRLAYSIGLAFCMVPCFTKQAGVIGQVLGSPVFEPLARLTYGTLPTPMPC